MLKWLTLMSYTKYLGHKVQNNNYNLQNYLLKIKILMNLKLKIHLMIHQIMHYQLKNSTITLRKFIMITKVLLLINVNHFYQHLESHLMQIWDSLNLSINWVAKLLIFLLLKNINLLIRCLLSTKLFLKIKSWLMN